MNGSLEVRINHVYQLLVLIEAAAAVNELQMPMDAQDLREAIGSAAHEASDILGTLKCDMPAAIANWEPKASH